MSGVLSQAVCEDTCFELNRMYVVLHTGLPLLDFLFWIIKLRRVPPVLANIFYVHARSSRGRLTRLEWVYSLSRICSQSIKYEKKANLSDSVIILICCFVFSTDKTRMIHLLIHQYSSGRICEGGKAKMFLSSKQYFVYDR